MEYTIVFVNQEKEIKVQGGTLADACAMAGYPLNLVCGGKGTCGKCKITVERDGKKEQVLACKTLVEQDEKIYITEADYEHKASVLTKSNLKNVEKNPTLRKEYKTKEALMPSHCGAFLENVSVPVMAKFAAMSSDFDFKGCTFVYFKDQIIDIQDGDTTDALYGAAVDIGTTTVVVYLYDLVEGKLIATKSGLNKQIVHGADVITRNVFSQEKPENLQEMKELVGETINQMLKEAIQDESIVENLYHIVLCGNSTMQHLFYGFNPTNLGVSPFANITAQQIFCSGREMGLYCAAEGMIEFLPLLGGFVGADTASVLLTLEADEKKYLMVDLGTNGEIAVGNYQKFFVSSTACGPALEGGNIACGMRGTNGAIEKISLADDKITLKVIGNTTALGLCGSAIIDAVAELRKVGMIDDAGTLLSPEEYKAAHPESTLGEHLREVEEYNMAFFFTEGEKPVYLCQQDIRQIQLAKSSIYAGCVTLLMEYGIDASQVDALVLAGAFGNYIDVDNALYIGLLPPVPRDKILSIGNGAGQGVQSILLDQAFRGKLDDISKNTEHVELAENPNFMDEYIMNMNFYN